MRFSDLLIDLNDIYGRLAPGIILLIDLYFIFNRFIIISHEKLLAYFKASAYLSILLIIIFFIVSIIIGELSAFIIFKFRKILLKNPIEIMEKFDVTEEKDLIKFFESKFDKKILQSDKKGTLTYYCKNYLLENCPNAYIEARKIEARINFMGGMVIPMIISMVVFQLYRQWLLSLLCLLLAAIFFHGFHTRFEVEDKFIFNAYYNCFKKYK